LRCNLLLEQKGTKTTVEGGEALLLEDATEARDKAGSEGGLGDQADTGGLKRAEGEISEELGAGGGGEVDGGAVVGSGLVAEEANGLLLEELVTTELQGTLEEVTSEGRAGTGEESASALILDDLLEAADEAAVVGLGVELDAGLDAVMRVSVKCAPDELNHRMCALDIGAKDLHIDGGKTTVGERAADGTGEGEARVESDTRELLGLSGLDVLLDGVELGAAGGGGRGLGGHCERCGRSGDGYGWW
jgi:hypothetical protein